MLQILDMFCVDLSGPIILNTDLTHPDGTSYKELCTNKEAHQWM